MSFLLEVTGWLGVLAALWYWVDAMRSKELARAAGRRACDEAGVQFLDDSVVLARVRPQRDARGRLGFHRAYHFEFTPDGSARQRGEVALLGRRVLHVSLGPARDPRTLH
jgi:hypothetical protein